jgi:hypothetical protein
MTPSLLGARALATRTPALAFAGFGLARILASEGTPDTFRAADVARARAAIEAVVPPGSLVLTSPALGRPAENWTYYTDVDAHYVGELGRLASDANIVANRCTESGRRFFLLLGPAEPLPLTIYPRFMAVREVERRDAEAARDGRRGPLRGEGRAQSPPVACPSVRAGAGFAGFGGDDASAGAVFGFGASRFSTPSSRAGRVSADGFDAFGTSCSGSFGFDAASCSSASAGSAASSSGSAFGSSDGSLPTSSLHSFSSSCMRSGMPGPSDG